MRTRKQQIIEATRELLAREGLRTVTMRRVAEQVGISAPSIYRHFESRDALLRAVIAQGSEMFANYLFRALEQSAPIDQLVATGMQYLKFAFEQETVFGLMFATWNELSIPEHSPQRTGDRLSPGLQFLLDRVGACLPREPSREALLELALEQWAVAHGLATLYLYGGARQMLDRETYEEMCRRIVHRAAQNLVSNWTGTTRADADPPGGGDPTELLGRRGKP